MSDTYLIFSFTPLGQPANLLFGESAAVPDAVVSFAAELPSLTLSANFIPVEEITFAATLPSMSLTITAQYNSDTARPTVGLTHTDWQTARSSRASTADTTHSLNKLPAISQSDWQTAKPCRADIATLLPHTMHATRIRTVSRQQDGQALQTSVKTAFAQLRRTNRPAIVGRFAHAARAETSINDDFRDRSRSNRPAVQMAHRLAKPLVTVRNYSAQAAQKLDTSRAARHQIAMRPKPGVSAVVTPPQPTDPCYLPPVGTAVALLFRDAATIQSDLIFVCERHIAPPATVIVPVRRTTIVLNNVQLRRVEGNYILPATSLQLSIDWDSWTWSFSTSMPQSAIALVEPGNDGDLVILEATINGASYLLLAEDIQTDRQFGKSTISVSGRGKSAMLADPYSPILSFSNATPRTAQQLMNDALTVNGVPLGWTIDWKIDDWLVPANTWNHQGSYMSAITTIAATAGAFIQPDPVQQVLRVRSRYPVKPWEWASATPDIELPSAAITKEAIAWTDNPQYNAVYISGSTSGGILAQVKRAGSAANNLAPMITDALITDVAPARQRGIATLATTGRNASYSLSLPVLPETGIIQPGTLVRYVDTNTVMGMVKGVSVTTEQAKVRQTIEVQTHG